MFIVSPVTRTRNTEVPTEFTFSWPVAFEQPERGYTTDPVAHKDSREAAQALADALNEVLGEHV
jgi:hypothetical protein